MILEMIFDGGSSLEDFARPKDSKYQQLNQSIGQLSEPIKGKLSKEDGELLDELLGQVYKSQYMKLSIASKSASRPVCNCKEKALSCYNRSISKHNNLIHTDNLVCYYLKSAP